MWMVYILGIKCGLLVMLKSENGTIHGVQYKRQAGFVLMFCSDYFKNG